MKESFKALLVILVISTLFLGAVFLVTGCRELAQGKAGIAVDIVKSQSAGLATGAGATLTGPTNSAAPSTQVSDRRTTYYRPYPDLTNARSGIKVKQAEPTQVVQQEVLQVEPMPSSVFEHTETTLGQHQSASAIMQAAAKLDSFNKIQWIGITCLFISYSALLWCYGHDDGYPVVYMKVALCGIAFLFCDNPWWILLLAIPFGFYFAQKLNLINLVKSL